MRAHTPWPLTQSTPATAIQRRRPCHQPKSQGSFIWWALSLDSKAIGSLPARGAGYSTNAIEVWRYPALTPVATLTGHTARVLFLATSPDGQSIVTGAGTPVRCSAAGVQSAHAAVQDRC